MLDIFDLPNNNNNRIFFNTGTTGWESWLKPRNAKFVMIYALGGGGGGGGGNTYGGGGGASSAITKGIFSAELIPDLLFVQVGAGGVGGVGSGAGTGGSASYVSIQPNTTASNVLLYSNGGGVGTSNVTNSGGGTAGAAMTLANALLNYIGTVQSIAGQAGANSANGSAAGASITVSYPVTGGGGGANSSSTTGYAGGSITGVGIIPTINGGTIGGVDGCPGIIIEMPSLNGSISRPPFFTGGGGGAAPTTSGVTNAGNGSFGSGGGGGAGRNGANSGTGGNGGDGIVIITSF